MLARAHELERGQVLVGKGQRKAVAKHLERLELELLGLVRRHAALAGAAHAVALLRLGQDHGGPPAVCARRGTGRVQLAKVVPAALERVDVGLAHVGHELLHLGVLAEEVLDVVGAVVGPERLVLPVHRAAERTQQHVARVARKERVPVAAPQHLDDVPARTGEERLELLDDLPVAAHGPVQALQVAVDDEGEVVQPLARGQREAGDRLGLVHLAVAEHAPDVARGGVQQPARLQVTHEARLVHGVQRPQAHRAGGELPEVGHQPRVRVGAQPAAAHLLAVARELLLGQAPLQEGARVHARGRVGLEVDEVARLPVGAAAEEVVEAELEDLGGRCVAGDVATELAVGLVGAHHHRQRIPAHQRREALLEHQVTGVGALALQRDRVAVGREGLHVRHDPELLGLLLELLEQVHAALGAARLDCGAQRLEPLGGLGRIGVEGLTRAGRGLEL